VTTVASLTRVWVVVEHTMPNAKINEVKDLALIFWSVYLPHQVLSSVKKTSWASLLLRIFFTHIHLMRCLSSMVNLVAVTTLLLSSGLHHC